MKRMFYSSVIATVAAIAPGLAFAQSVVYGAQPYYRAAPYQPYTVPAQHVWTGYWQQGSFPAVNQGQASASAHGPSYAGELSTERSH
jgi:hypothetical protein